MHARGQVVHFDLTEDEWLRLPRGRDISPAESLLRRVGGVLSRQDGAVIVRGAAAVADDFDARFSALSRSYTYRLADGAERRDPLRRFDTAWHPRGLDERLMDAEATSAVASDGGLRDFGSFCKPRERSTTIRQLQHFSIRRGLSLIHI